jgi:hypothetical protein
VGFLDRVKARLAAPTSDASEWFTLCGESITSVVGESNYQRCLDTTVRSATAEPPFELEYEPLEGDQKLWFPVYLRREPDNKYDPNAVSAASSHGVVGYLERNNAKRFQSVLELLESHGHRGIACPAYARRADNGMWGVVLVLSSARKSMSYVKADKSFRVLAT